jgi:hypothetical protein
MQYRYEKVKGGKRVTSIVDKPNAMSNTFRAIRGMCKKFKGKVFA